MNKVRLAKIVGIICSVSVLCAMKSGILASAIMLFAALPAAIACRRRMDEEE